MLVGDGDNPRHDSMSGDYNILATLSIGAPVNKYLKKEVPPMSETIPKHLNHKPIYYIDNYSKIDGHYRSNTDTVYLSLGKAQWDNKKFVPSVKVWRRKNQWSPQSEETTLTRALDLATLVVMVLDSLENKKEIQPVYTVFGDFGISEVENNDMLKDQLIRYLDENNKKNLNDINAHIEILYKAISNYTNNRK